MLYFMAYPIQKSIAEAVFSTRISIQLWRTIRTVQFLQRYLFPEHIQ